MKRRRRSDGLRFRDEAAIACALALLAALVAYGGWSWRLDRLVYDIGLSLSPRSAPPAIVIVAIDDASVEAIGRWPWPRTVHATFLEQLARAHPRAVFLDVVFSEPDPAADPLLAQAIADASPLVLPVAWRQDADGTLAALEPVAPLRAVARLGAAEPAFDADGVLRHAFLYAGPARAPYPHTALALLEAGGEHPAADLPLDDAPAAAPWVRRDRFLVRYVGPIGSIDRVSYIDVLRGRVPAARLAGRYVLVGMTAQGLGDTVATPMNGRSQAMPGIEAQANVLYTLRSGDTVREVGEGALAALSALALAALVFSFAAAGPRRALPLALASVPAAVLASLLALRWGLWCSPVPYALAALPAYPLWSWRRLERAVVGLDREIERVAADPLLARGGTASRRVRGGDLIESRLDTLRRAGTLVRDVHRFVAESLAAMPAALLVTDADALVVLANSKAASLFEVESADEMRGLDLPRLLAEFTTAGAVDWIGVCAGVRATSEGVAVEARLAGAGDFVVQLAALDLQSLRRLVVTIADIGLVKRAQREREEALAFVSHDLRAPASSIMLLADLHLEGRMHQPTEDLLREVRQLAARMLTMSEDFVRTAELRTRTLARQPARARALVDEALGDLHGQAIAGGVRLAVDVVDEAAVALDRALVVRAITNLVSNAIKHSRSGDAVELRARAGAAGLEVSVRDHGPGLSQDQFEQLARGDVGAPVRDRRGIGLGLVFVQRVAARHGGSLRATPADGGGALFELRLPSGNP